MVFRPISSVLADVMADLRSEIDGTATRGSNVRASGRSTAVKGVATGHGEGAKPVAFARQGEVTRAQTGINGGGATVFSTELPQPTKGVFATSYGVRLAYSSKGMPRLSNTTPHRGLGIHLRLVVSH